MNSRGSSNPTAANAVMLYSTLSTASIEVQIEPSLRASVITSIIESGQLPFSSHSHATSWLLTAYLRAVA